MKKIYVCGPTVYDKVHIGNMRPILSYDIYIRALRFLNEEVIFIHNITDIDDKIINKSIKENKTEVEISTFYKEHYFALLKQMNIVAPTHLPSVMENMDEIISFIEKIIANGYAYEINGDVYFSIDKLKEYGQISKQNTDNLISDEKNDNKRNKLDFALWKKTSLGILFDSPWGKGRPGWHTECSAFIGKYLNGESLDVHGGGIDLIFPHHENENAQYIAAYGKSISHEWKHIGHLFYHGEKMSKSIGNLIQADEFIEMYGVDTLRLIFLQSNPMSPINIHIDSINNAIELINKFRKVYATTFISQKSESIDNDVLNDIAKSIIEWNFANAMKIVNEQIKNYNKGTSNSKTIIKMFELLGFSFINNKISDEEIRLFKDWEKLRNEKKYQEADEIREKLKHSFLI